MASVYSTPFLRVELTPGATFTYTTPDGYLTVIRDVIMNSLFGDGGWTARVIAGGTELFTRSFPAQYQGWWQADCRVALPAAEDIIVTSLDSGSLSCAAGVYVGGYLLKLP
jgi:hypothetical protein